MLAVILGLEELAARQAARAMPVLAAAVVVRAVATTAALALVEAVEWGFTDREQTDLPGHLAAVVAVAGLVAGLAVTKIAAGTEQLADPMVVVAAEQLGLTVSAAPDVEAQSASYGQAALGNFPQLA